MKILHVVAGLSPSGGGLSEAVPMFAWKAAMAGQTVILATIATDTDRLSDVTEKARSYGVKVVCFAPSWPHFLFFSWQMFFGFRYWVKQADIIHIHSNWTFPVWWACLLAILLGKPYVMSPHGAFDPVRLIHSAWKKKLVGWMDRFFLRRAALVHALSEVEAKWIECAIANKRTRQMICIVPNGVEYLDKDTETARKCCDRLLGDAQEKTRTVLYLGRNHPLKGLDILGEAWQKVKRDGWRLALVGAGLPDGVVEGEKKWSVLRSADVFVLPTRSEGFPLSVLEALAVGVPVITTKGAPWEELVSEQCGWWVDVGVEPLADALREAMNLTDKERRVMGENGQRLIERKYKWETVAKQMVELYETVAY